MRDLGLGAVASRRRVPVCGGGGASRVRCGGGARGLAVRAAPGAWATGGTRRSAGVERAKGREAKGV